MTAPIEYFRGPQQTILKKVKSVRTFDIRKLLLGVTLLLILIFMKKTFLFVVFIALTAIITYYTKLYHVPIDISPLFFLQIVITRYYGLKYTAIFILLGYFVPKIIAGHAANWMSYAFIGLSMLCNLLSVYMGGLSLQAVGYITSVIQYIGGIFITMTMKPFYFAALDGIANVTNNLIWFLIFSDFIILLF
jgi:hypothetical protein